MTINKSQITAVILAGGKGRRLGGQDKGLVSYQGKKLIEHALDKIKPQVSEILINANRNQDEYKNYGYPVIDDEMHDFQGPLAGFLTAMKMVKTDYIVTLPCDGPELSEDFVERMASKLSTTEDEIAVAHDGERMQPVHALIPVTLAQDLEAFLESGDRKIDRWYAQHKTALVDFSDKPEVFFNVNTEEQRLEGKSK